MTTAIQRAHTARGRPDRDTYDWAAVAALLVGRLTYQDVHPVDVLEAIRRLEARGLSGEDIGAELGMSGRHVTRFRNGHHL